MQENEPKKFTSKCIGGTTLGKQKTFENKSGKRPYQAVCWGLFL